MFETIVEVDVNAVTETLNELIALIDNAELDKAKELAIALREEIANPSDL